MAQVLESVRSRRTEISKFNYFLELVEGDRGVTFLTYRTVLRAMKKQKGS